MLSDKWQEIEIGSESFKKVVVCYNPNCLYIGLSDKFYHNHTKDASDVQFSMLIKDAARALVSEI